jgi:phosphatidylglycerol:prolipoprotein diacylglycerol transferase
MIKFPDIDPVIISFGSLGVSWYSLSYVVGILVGWIYIVHLIKRHNLPVTYQHIDDLVTWLIVSIVMGGRLGYVLFYDPVKYLSNPVQILKIYEGGMSFHGGILGVVIALCVFARTYDLSFLLLCDLCAAATPFALFLGRIANFINAELYGRVTDVPWGVVFPYTDGMPRHPSQLYEAFTEGVILFFLLLYFSERCASLRKRGMTSGLFLIFYSCFRVLIEFFREADAHIGYFMNYFTLGQILCLPMFFAGCVLLISSRISTRVPGL